MVNYKGIKCCSKGTKSAMQQIDRELAEVDKLCDEIIERAKKLKQKAREY